jgi:hypothetical protein
LYGLRAILRQDPKFATVHHVQLVVPGPNRDSYQAVGIYTTRDEALDACPRAVWDHIHRKRPPELVQMLPWRKQKDIATVLGVTDGTVSCWVAGKSDVSVAIRAHIARIFGVCYDPKARKIVWTKEGKNNC